MIPHYIHVQHCVVDALFCNSRGVFVVISILHWLKHNRNNLPDKSFIAFQQ